ncbi:MAG TPA: O-antigen polymerase [Candidatus Acidoferrum sp.]|jgi:oligosaccharide repeat unit polymerase
MIVHLIFTGCVLGLTVLNYYAGRRNVLYPAFFFSLIWLVVLCLYLVPLVELNPLGAVTLAIVTSGIVAFSAGASFAGWWHPRPPVASLSRNSVKRALFFYCLAALPLFFLETRRLSAAGGLEGFLFSARASLIEATENGERQYSSPLYTITVTLSVFVAFILLIEAREWKKERVWVWGSILTAVAFAVLTTGRVTLLGLTAGLTGIFLLKKKQFSAKEAWKFFRWPLAAILILFLVLVLFTKDISQDEGTKDIFARLVFGYAVLPLAGFDYVVHHDSEYKHDPNHTFAPVLAALVPLGVQYRPPPPNDFISVPVPVNVFTVFRFFYVDFGFAGMLVVLFLIGAGQTWIFRKALIGDHLYIFLFAVSLYPLAMVAFDDQYSQILTLAFWKQPLFAVLYFRVLRAI